MSSISILGPIASTIASSLFDELKGVTLFSKVVYFVKKYLLPNVYCIVLDDYSYNKINVNTSDKEFIMLHPEKIFSLIMSDSDRANLKKIKVENFDSYILLAGAKLKKIVNNMRFLHKKSKFIVVVSSYNLAKCLHFKDKQFFSFLADDDLFKEMINKASDAKELQHVITLREQQKNDCKFEYFESFKQLNNLVCGVSDDTFKPNTAINALPATIDDSASTD